MVTTTSIPTRQELVRRASDIVPILQKHASWNEQNRRIHEESLQALEQAGLFRLRGPLRYGSSENDIRTPVEGLGAVVPRDSLTPAVALGFASQPSTIRLVSRT